MGLLAVKECSMSIEDAIHYITSEMTNMIETNTLPTIKLVDLPYHLLDAEYLLFENTTGSNNNVIKVNDVDKILSSLAAMYKEGINIRTIKIDSANIMFIKQVINVG